MLLKRWSASRYFGCYVEPEMGKAPALLERHVKIGGTIGSGMRYFLFSKEG